MKKDILILKILLSILTVLQITALYIMFSDTAMSLKLNEDFHLNILLTTYSWALTAVFIWYNWKKLPIDKKKKKDKTWMLALLGIAGLGIIGMWLWLPNKKELDSYLK